MPPKIRDMAAAPLNGYSLMENIFSMYGWSSTVTCPAAMAPMMKQTGGVGLVGSGGTRLDAKLSGLYSVPWQDMPYTRVPAGRC